MRSRAPAIVFLDFGMPGADGCETVTAARAMEGAVARAMLICLTGRRDPGEAQRCLDAGFDRFVSKPMDPALLPDCWPKRAPEALLPPPPSPADPAADDA